MVCCTNAELTRQWFLRVNLVMLEVLIRQHFHDNACILADSDSKPKLETVAGKVKVKSDLPQLLLLL